MNTTSLADAKNRLSELVRSVELTHERAIITKNGRPVAALLSIADLESLEATLEITTDPQLLAEIRQVAAELKQGKGEVRSRQQMLDMIARRSNASEGA